jgi:peptide/nickel transport system substrate-binding protein
MKLTRTLIVAGAAMFMAAPALAQKKADTLRLAFNDSFTTLSNYVDAANEIGFYSRGVYESLLAYNEHTGKWLPKLAKSWSQPSPLVYDFDLAENVKFHNGNKFDADDVVATWANLLDPATKLRFKNRYDWIAKVEKLGPYKVRLHAKEPNAVGMGLIAYRFVVEDAESLNALSDKMEYGRVSPHGTGVYKVNQIDKNKGLILERFEEYAGDKSYSRAPAKRIHGMFVPDKQTQIAQLMTGGLDLVNSLTGEQASALKSHPDIEITNSASSAFFYLNLDAGGRSGNKPLTDVRVRRAMFMAIDREAIMKYIVPGGEVAEKIDVPCFPSTIACKYTVKQPDFNPEGAKKLLAEAGYPNGFELEYAVFTPVKDIGVAIAGDLLKVGIRANVQPVTLQIYRKLQSDGKLQAFSFFFPIGGHPDASSAVNGWFEGDRADYFKSDPVVIKGLNDAMGELDLAKREDNYRTAFDQIIREAYVLPISSLPDVFAHGKDVKVLTNQMSPTEKYVMDFAFK